MSRTDNPKGRGNPRNAKARAKPTAQEKAIKDKAQELTKQGMPFQLAMAVAQGRLDLNTALERLARRAEVDRLMRKHDLNRALATQIAMGHADLEAFLAKRRMGDHRETHRDQSCLDAAHASGEPLTFGLHGGRVVSGRIVEVGPYEVVLAEDGGEQQSVHKLQFKYAYGVGDWKRVRKSLTKDKALAGEPRGPIERPQDRYTISDKRLFRYLDEGTMVDVTLLEGEVFRGQVSWFGRYEFGLRVKGDVDVTIFRHALFHVGHA